MKDAIIANTTAIAIGTNRKPATPGSANIGTNTMQMHSSDTKAGVTICAAPSRIAVWTSLPCSRCQLIFSIVTVASSTRMPTARARPPSVMTFSVSPTADSAKMAASTASGIDSAMMTVERHEPRNSRIIRLVSAAAIAPSLTTPDDGRLHEQRLIANGLDLERGRQALRDRRNRILDAFDDRKRRGGAVLEHGDQHRALAVDVHDIGLRRGTVADISDIAHVDGGAVDGLDRQIVETVDRVRRVVELHAILIGADLREAGRIDLVLRGDGVPTSCAESPRACSEAGLMSICT
jgi:hypothetical protein